MTDERTTQVRGDVPGDALRGILAAGRLGVLATTRGSGRPQMSTVAYAYDPRLDVVRVSVTDERAKTRNLRRDARAAFHVAADDGWSYVVADVSAELAPVARAADDATTDELVEVYRALQGEHPDWDAFRQAMVDDRRLVLRLHVERVYGWGGQDET